MALEETIMQGSITEEILSSIIQLPKEVQTGVIQILDSGMEWVHTLTANQL